MGRDMGSGVEGTPIRGTGWCKNDQNWGRPQLDEKPMKNGKDNELTSDILFVLNSKTCFDLSTSLMQLDAIQLKST